MRIMPLMKLNAKSKMRLLAFALFLAGTTAFLSGQPSRRSESDIAAAKADYEKWQLRHNEDIRNGRVSSAGPSPEIEFYTATNKALVFMGFAMGMVSIIVVTLTLM